MRAGVPSGGERQSWDCVDSVTENNEKRETNEAVCTNLVLLVKKVEVDRGNERKAVQSALLDEAELW